MQFDQERPMLGRHRSVNSRAKDVLVKVAAVTAGAIMLISALVLSIVFVAGALAVLLIVGGYFLWKTREVRKQMRTQFAQGQVIEGVVVREVVTNGGEERPVRR